MTSDTPNAHDPRRSLELLWGRHEPGRRGPKPKLSLEEVIAAAIAIADREGVEALSIRRVAEKVGLSPMALYTYAPSKAELLELMYDRAMGELEAPDPALPGWREKLEAVARQLWALGHRHPWMMRIATHRPPLGPNFMQRMETVFRAIDGVGLDELEMELVEGLLTDYVRGAVRSALEAREVEQRSGMTDEQWLAIAEPTLMEILDPEAFPVLHRVGEALMAAYDGAFDRTRGFEFGLQRVLDGIEMFIARKRGATA
ncbi:TetR/AcrR family transcriptional regulator [Phenylobacterium sp.]|uniref:TetR/AcrR family transcriptional regulator n=1 Tax=Phenylobacterium sp. TaxID=1871053 RepID=UPI0035B3B98B